IVMDTLIPTRLDPLSLHDALPILFARQLIASLEEMGIHVFPDLNTCWHYDDKVGQKYLLEAIGAPLVPTHIFYDRAAALAWAERSEEHTSELQSRENLVCRLLLEK